jgi:hypothetical protein
MHRELVERGLAGLLSGPACPRGWRASRGWVTTEGAPFVTGAFALLQASRDPKSKVDLTIIDVNIAVFAALN